MASSGNFATWNAVVKPAYTDFEHGNTKSNGSSASDAAGANSSIGVSSGKWYMEMYLTVNTTYPTLGLSPGASAGDNRPYNQNSGYLNIVRYTPGGSSGSRLADNSSIFTPASFGTVTLTQTNVDSAATGDIIGFALDVDNRKLWISKNGTFFNSGDPAAGSNQQISWTANPPEIFFQCQTYTGGRAVHGNWGQDSTFAGNTSAGGNADENGFGDFKYSVPTGFLALCSANLPVSDDIDPAQTDDDYPTKQFGVTTYSGTLSSSGVAQITHNLGFKPDFIWSKGINAGQRWAVRDSTRGPNQMLASDEQTADVDKSGNGDMGSTFATDTTFPTNYTDGMNGSGNFVAHCWKANGGTTTSDSSGDITVTRQTNTAGGFSILTYTGNGSADQTIAHGLGATPAWIITKNRSSSSHWAVWHHQYTGYYGQLEASIAWASDSSQFYTAGMTSNFIGVKGSGATNSSGHNMVAYVWAEVEGYSKFGKYEGNGNTDGPFIYTGFRPRMLFIRNTEQSSNWVVYDSERQTFNPNENYLRWNSTATEGGTSNLFDIDFLSNGCKVRSTETDLNTSGKTFIYGAWGDVPLKYNNTF